MEQLNKLREIVFCSKNYIHDISRRMKHKTADMVEKIPNPLYKYYAVDSKYDAQRLSGKLYFSSPIDFNDPYDCQTDVYNNLPDLMKQKSCGREWAISKLHELGFNKNVSENLFRRICENDKDAVEEVHNKQIEKLGILCATTDCINITMWAYYTNHKGYCLEYDTTDIMRDITIDYINQMDESIIKQLWTEKGYNKRIEEKSCDRPKRQCEAKRLFSEKTLEYLTNNYFKNKPLEQILNFVRNVYIKRCWANKIKYVKKLNSGQRCPYLFYDKKRKTLRGKYNHKLKNWSAENEYRIGLSLGGRKSIQINESRIKQVIFGYNIKKQQKESIIDLLRNKNVAFKQIEKAPTGFTLKDISFNDILQ